MSVTFTIDNQSRVALIAVNGKLSFDGVEHSIKSFYDETPSLNVLWDFSAVMEIDLSMQETYQLANILKQARREKEKRKTALVSPGETVAGSSRVLEIFLEAVSDSKSLDIKVFRDKELALQWLMGRDE
jgi:hypothetical protein